MNASDGKLAFHGLETAHTQVCPRRVRLCPRRVRVSPRRVCVCPRRIRVCQRCIHVCQRYVRVCQRRICVRQRRVRMWQRRVGVCVCVSKGVPLPEYLRGALQREPQEDVRMHKLCNREPCMQGSLLIRGRPRGIPTGSVGAVRVRAVQKRGSLLNKAHCSPGGSWKKSPQTTSCRPPAGCGEPRMSRIWRRGAEGRGACWPNFSKAAVHVTLLAAQWSAFRRS